MLDSDIVISEAELQAKINRRIAEYERDKAIAIQEDETSEAYLARLLSE